MRVNTLLQAIREELVPTIIALAVFVPLAYLYLTGGEPPDSLVGIAGLIVGYYYTRQAVTSAASAVRTTAAAIASNGHGATPDELAARSATPEEIARRIGQEAA